MGVLLFSSMAYARQPNIILMMTDDHGWGDVGFNGNTDIITPSLDRVCEQGARLYHFFAAAPVCSPTRGSVLTGRHYYRYGIWGANDGRLPRQEYSIAQGLKDVGYTTGHFGKWHVGSPHPDYRGKGGGGNADRLALPQHVEGIVRAARLPFAARAETREFAPAALGQHAPHQLCHLLGS